MQVDRGMAILMSIVMSGKVKFLGVWLGGKMYDIYGTYTAVWWVGVGVGLFSAVVHLPIKERPLPIGLAKVAG